MNEIDRGYETAFQIRKNLKIPSTEPVNLHDVTKSLNIKVKEANLGTDILGACKTDGIIRKILLHNAFDNPGRKRFTLAHEIGHLLIHHDSFYCKKEFFNTYRSQAEVEREANSFAAELLLPQSVVREALKKNDLDYQTISNSAQQYEISISACSIQMTRLYTDSAITLFHDGDRIFWSVRSAECSYKTPVALPSHQFIKSSIAKSLVNPQLWIENEDEGLCCEQETMYFNKLDKYLTIIKFYTR